MKPRARRTGVRLRELAARWYDAATLERCIDPALADLQAEYEDARRRGRTWRSRWIWIRGHAAFLTTVMCCGGGQAMDLSDGDRRALGRTAVYGTAVMIALTVVFAARPFRSFVEAGHPDAAMLAVFLIPQALPASIPLGLMLGVFWGLGRSGVSLRSRAVVLLAAAALSSALLGVLGWLAPSSNQAFRVAVARPLGPGEFVLGELPKGANEMTLGEIRRRLRSPVDDPRYLPDDISNLASNYYRRWAMTFAPIVLSFFALVVIGRGHRSALLLTAVAFASVFGYFLLARVGNTLDMPLPASAAAWVPNIVFFAAAVVGTVIRTLRSTPASA
jgi:hypothetical protein